MRKIPIETAVEPIFSESGREVYILSGDIGGKHNIMTASWCMKVAKGPNAMWAVSIGKDRYTDKLMNVYEDFVIAFPRKGDYELLEKIGSCHGNKVDKFKKYSLLVAKANHVKAPLLRGCVGNLEVIVTEVVDCGSHNLYIGGVSQAWEGE